jgi:hypothetical protein
MGGEAATIGTTIPPGIGSNVFGIVSERNVFDPVRGHAQILTRVLQPARTESLTLVGTLHSDHGAFAFFSGSSMGFRKVVKPGETIAGYKVTEIAHDYVRLAGNAGQVINLPMQKEMKFSGVNSISREQ